MNYYGGKEMAASFRTVRNNTIIIAEEIPEEHYGFRPTPESRSVAQTLVHIAVLPQLQEQVHAIEKRTSVADFDFPTYFGKLIAQEQVARTKAEIIAFLRSEGDRFAGWLEGVTDEFLGQTITFPEGMVPATKTRFEMLSAPKEHEMHHRAQLMLMERLLGIVPHMTRAMQARMASMSKP